MVFMDAVSRAYFWSCPIANGPKILKLRFFEWAENSTYLLVLLEKCCNSETGVAVLWADAQFELRGLSWD